MGFLVRIKGSVILGRRGGGAVVSDPSIFFFVFSRASYARKSREGPGLGGRMVGVDLYRRHFYSGFELRALIRGLKCGMFL